MTPLHTKSYDSRPGDPNTRQEVDLLDRFYRLPRAIDRMLLQRGLVTIYQRANLQRALDILDQGLDNETREAISGAGCDSEQSLERIQKYLARCSTDALAFHLYTKELLRLVQKTAAGQPTRQQPPLSHFPKSTAGLRAKRR